jgi:prepilin-type N-terminal cleavage/methylation domain-containing protein
MRKVLTLIELLAVTHRLSPRKSSWLPRGKSLDPARGNFLRKAFTLIELLVVIAIVAVLAVVVVLTLNPAGLMQESRDSNRISDMATLQSGISLFLADVQSANALGQANTLYVSVPDPSATSTAGDQCQGLGLPSLSGTGFAYQCAASSTFRKTDGTGWIPINFQQASFGAPVAELPIDPSNATSTGLYDTYATNGTQYEVTSLFESQKDKLLYGTSPMDPAIPRSMRREATCPSTPSGTRAGSSGGGPYRGERHRRQRPERERECGKLAGNPGGDERILQRGQGGTVFGELQRDEQLRRCGNSYQTIPNHDLPLVQRK